MGDPNAGATKALRRAAAAHVMDRTTGSSTLLRRCCESGKEGKASKSSGKTQPKWKRGGRRKNKNSTLLQADQSRFGPAMETPSAVRTDPPLPRHGPRPLPSSHGGNTQETTGKTNLGAFENHRPMLRTRIGERIYHHRNSRNAGEDERNPRTHARVLRKTLETNTAHRRPRCCCWCWWRRARAAAWQIGGEGREYIGPKCGEIWWGEIIKINQAGVRRTGWMGGSERLGFLGARLGHGGGGRMERGWGSGLGFSPAARSIDRSISGGRD